MKKSQERLLIENQLMRKKCQLYMTVDLNCNMKNSHESKILRNKGNELYKNEDCDKEKVLKLYTKSIGLAKSSSEDLALAYSNRSALLYRMNRFQESILDIDRALKISKLDLQLKIKCLSRKIKCLVNLGNSECNEVYEEMNKLIVDNCATELPQNIKKLVDNHCSQAEDAMNVFRKTNSSTDQGSPEYSKDFKEKLFNKDYDCVKMQYNTTYGKHFVAKKDVVPGEILFVDEPYVSHLNETNFYL